MQCCRGAPLFLLRGLFQQRGYSRLLDAKRKGQLSAAHTQLYHSPNDFERIWFLTDAFLIRAIESGPELCKAYFILELQHSCELFDILESFNDWIALLIANCQASGIAGIKGKPAELVPIQLNLAKAILFDWVRTDDSFPLGETVRRNIEVFLDIKPQYRAKYQAS